MSLILEALKKSERERRLGETPSLGSPVMGVRRRRSKLPLLFGLIAVALVAGWWLRRAPQPEPPAAAAVAPVPPGSVVPPPVPDTVPAAPAAAESAAAREPARSTADSRMPRSKLPPDATAGMPADVRAKVRNGELVVANPALLKPGQPATVAQDPPSLAGETARPPATGPALPPAAEVSTPAPVIDARAQAPVAAPPAVVPAARAAAATAGGMPAAQAGAAPKLIWELPYAQRRELPEIKLSMHVYAAEPVNRFVIINGNRQVEGDDIESLRLVEIRVDGIVFEHQGQRFLYPRGGR